MYIQTFQYVYILKSICKLDIVLKVIKGAAK